MLKIVLASQSPRRKKLLSQIGLSFQIIPSSSEEIITSNVPEEVVVLLAEQKALDVAKNLENRFIIAADTVVAIDGEILGKPETKEDAVTMLAKLSSQTHQVFTGVCLIITNSKKEILKRCSFYEETKVTFSALTSDEINAYVATGSPMDKAGSYGIQDDLGAIFVEKIEGDYYNVVGFPLNRFYKELKQFEPSLVPINLLDH